MYHSQRSVKLNDLNYFCQNIATNHFRNGYQIIQFNHFCLLPINQLNQIINEPSSDHSISLNQFNWFESIHSIPLK